MFRPPPSSTLFPYTTLFRSCQPFCPLLKMRLAPSQGITLPRSALFVAGPGPVVVQAEEGDHGLRVGGAIDLARSEEHTSELQSRVDLVCRLLLEKKKNKDVDSDTCPPFCHPLVLQRKRQSVPCCPAPVPRSAWHVSVVARF